MFRFNRHQINHTDIFYFIILKALTLAISTNTPPDDGD